MSSYSFSYLDNFKKDYKELKKRNHNLDKEFEIFLDGFDHRLGVFAAGTGGAQKIRVGGAGRGKSAAYRIYYYYAFANCIYLLRMYSKSDKNDLNMKDKIEISEIVRTIKNKER